MLRVKVKYFLFFLFITAILYFVFIHSTLISVSNNPGVSSDEETNYAVALSLYRGEGPYKGYSIVYPPGRFIAQSILFYFLSPSIPTARLYFNLLAPIFFPPLLFFMTLQMFQILLKNKKHPTRLALSYIAAITSVFVYIFFVGGAQEVHVFIALFFLIFLSPFKSDRFKFFLQGVALGLVFVFRIESGVLLSLALLLSGIQKRDYKKYLPLFQGLLLIWIPLLLFIAITGSLSNFLYDTLYLGLIIQPQMMSLPIPPPPVGLVFFAILVFLLGATLGLYLREKTSALASFSVFAILSFAAALGRSDEAHLWYGSVWLSVFIVYCAYVLLSRKFSLRSLQTILPLSIALWGLGLFFIKIKAASIFIMLIIVLFFLMKKYKKTKSLSYEILITGLVTSLLIFHSFSFIKLRFHLPKISFQTSFYPNVFKSDKGEIAGLNVGQKTLNKLSIIDKHLNKNSSFLFIYPDNVFYYNYFLLRNPTRHYYHTGETTEKLQQEIVEDLERTKTINFLVFPKRVTHDGLVWKWILKNTYVDSKYDFEGLQAELRKRKL